MSSQFEAQAGKASEVLHLLRGQLLRTPDRPIIGISELFLKLLFIRLAGPFGQEHFSYLLRTVHHYPYCSVRTGHLKDQLIKLALDLLHPALHLG